MPSTETLIVADALKADIISRYGNAGGPDGKDVNADRPYTFEINLGTLNGVWILIFPQSKGGGDNLTRKEYTVDATVLLTIFERYTGKGKPSAAWMDSRIDWVNDNIWDQYSSTFNPAFLNPYWTQFASWDTLYDYDLLKQDKFFASEMTLTFRRILNFV